MSVIKARPSTRAERRAAQDRQRAAKALACMGPAATELILLRHGETDWNLNKRLQGQSVEDPSLNATGFRQAIALAEAFRDRVPDALYSSDLLRTRQTAEVFAEVTGLRATFDRGLRERHLGILEGLTHDEAQAQQPAALESLLSMQSDVRIPGGGESINDLMARVEEAIEGIATRHPSQRVAVIMHGGVLNACFRRAVGHDFKGKNVNTAVNRIRIENDKWAVVEWGDTSHLVEQGIYFSKDAWGGSRTTG